MNARTDEVTKSCYEIRLHVLITPSVIQSTNIHSKWKLHHGIYTIRTFIGEEGFSKPFWSHRQDLLRQMYPAPDSHGRHLQPQEPSRVKGHDFPVVTVLPRVHDRNYNRAIIPGECKRKMSWVWWRDFKLLEADVDISLNLNSRWTHYLYRTVHYHKHWFWKLYWFYFFILILCFCSNQSAA